MDYRIATLALCAVLLSGTATLSAYGQSAVTVTTDKEEYATGDIIMIEGSTTGAAGGAVSIIVMDPNGKLVTISQLTPVGNAFTGEIRAGGGQWAEVGAYTITAQAGTAKGETTFEFTAGAMPEAPAAMTSDDTDTLDVTDMVNYDADGAVVDSVVADPNTNSVTITMSATGDGMLTITFPRTILDATVDGGDAQFVVMADSEEAEFDEERTDDERTLTIPFAEGTEQIEIIGTFAAPEFGTIAALILVVAIVSIIAISTKTTLFARY